MNKAPINVQDSFFYNLRKDNVPVPCGSPRRDRMGRLGGVSISSPRVGVRAREMIYKHAIAPVGRTAPAGS
jgi:hypothetical protein